LRVSRGCWKQQQVRVAVLDVDGAASLAYAVSEDLHQAGGAFPD
jgi:hypothetical protein